MPSSSLSRKKKPRLIFCYSKNPKCAHGRHSGIGISCLNTAKALMADGHTAEVWPIAGGDELWKLLFEDAKTSSHRVTHIVIGALFIPTDYLAKLAFAFPNIKFVINSHSNVGFLQSEPAAIKKFRETLDLQTESRNVFAAGNSSRFVNSMRIGYGNCLYLPNLYYMDGSEKAPRVTWRSGTLKIGCFGALRVQKNFSTAIVACVEAGKQLRADVEIWINTGRDDANGSVVYRSARAWTDNLAGVKLKELPWQQWAEFRRVVSTLDMLVQPSYSETFSQVAADACVAGIPTISGDAIEWLPDAWKADVDDSTDIALHIRHVLLDPHSGALGLQAIKDRNEVALLFWRQFLK